MRISLIKVPENKSSNTVEDTKFNLLAMALNNIMDTIEIKHKDFIIQLCEMVLNGEIDHDHKQSCEECIKAIEVIEKLEKI